MFTRKQSEAPKPFDISEDRRIREERRNAILAAGPDQPCMSVFTYDPMGYCNIVCQTGLPAGQPHEHRAISVGDFRERAAWGSAHGNPFEDDDRERMNKEWLTEQTVSEPFNSGVDGE